jgi:hypothetical protein
VLLTGCATVPPAAELTGVSSSFAFSAGRGSQAFAASPAAVLAALQPALEDLSFQRVQVARDGAVTRIDAHTADRDHAVLTVRTHRDRTHVSVRIGWFGDEPLSRALLERVSIRLGTSPPEAIPATPPSAPAANPFFSRDAVPNSEMLRDFVEAPYRDRVIP